MYGETTRNIWTERQKSLNIEITEYHIYKECKNYRLRKIFLKYYTN